MHGTRPLSPHHEHDHFHMPALSVAWIGLEQAWQVSGRLFWRARARERYRRMRAAACSLVSRRLRSIMSLKGILGIMSFPCAWCVLCVLRIAPLPYYIGIASACGITRKMRYNTRYNTQTRLWTGLRLLLRPIKSVFIFPSSNRDRKALPSSGLVRPSCSLYSRMSLGR